MYRALFNIEQKERGRRRWWEEEGEEETLNLMGVVGLTGVCG